MRKEAKEVYFSLGEEETWKIPNILYVFSKFFLLQSFQKVFMQSVTLKTFLFSNECTKNNNKKKSKIELSSGQL